MPEPMHWMSGCSATSWEKSSATPAGPELLADVEQFAARRDRGGPSFAADGYPAGGLPGADPAGDEIAKLVASRSLAAAEQVARAFTVYF